MRVGLIDYGIGNLGSVRRTLELLDVETLLVRSPDELESADQLILPGVGSFLDCRAALDTGGWTEPLLHAVTQKRRPILGICVGMQLLATSGKERSEGEGTQGLGLIPGKVENLRVLGCTYRLPHVGWNSVRKGQNGAGKEVLAHIPCGTDFYFTHSFMFVPDDPARVAAIANYGIEVTAAVRAGHVWGTQFHPEKSSKAGFQLLRNFLEFGAC